MKTSFRLNQHIEDYLLGKLNKKERKSFENKISVDVQLAETVEWQKEVYRYVRCYGRENLRQELKKLDYQLFHHPNHLSFRQKIKQIFSS